MALTTYAELVAALDGSTGYLHRSDLTARIPDFIKLAESEINSDLALLLQEVETTLTATVSSRQMAVPTRFGTPIALWCTTYSPRIEIVYRNASELPVSDTAGPAQFYTVDGDYIATDNLADVAYTYTLRYLTNFDLATTLTNTVLTNWPKIYLFGTLLQSIAYTRDLSQQGYWQSEYNAALAKAMKDTVATKSKQTLRIDPFFGARRNNVYRGN
jgi:hypothetical protein